MSRMVLAVVVVLCCALGGAADDRTKLTPAELLKKADKNGDGKLSLEEFMAGVYPSPKHAPKKFAKADTNGDGKLDLKELEAVLPQIPWWQMSRKPAEAFFKEADAN